MDLYFDNIYIPKLLKLVDTYAIRCFNGSKVKVLEKLIRTTLRTVLEWLCVRNGLMVRDYFNPAQVLGLLYPSEPGLMEQWYPQLREWCDKVASAEEFHKHLSQQEFKEFKEFILKFLHRIKERSLPLKFFLEEKYPIEKTVSGTESIQNALAEVPQLRSSFQSELVSKSNILSGISVDKPHNQEPQSPPQFSNSGIGRPHSSCSTRSSNGPSLELGQVLDEYGQSKGLFHYPLELQRLGEVVFGTPGSGKSMYILNKVTAFRERGIGTLILQCEGRDARHLKDTPIRNPKGIKEIRYFTPGIEDFNPLRYNPLVVPQGVRVQTHIEHFAAIFTFAFDLPPPFPSLMHEALDKVFTDRGWDITHNRPPQGVKDIFPHLVELIPAVELVLTLTKRYSEKVRDDLKDVLRTRLKDLCRYGLGKMFNSKDSFSFEEMLTQNIVFELENMDNGTKRFFVGLFLTTVREYLQSKGEQDNLKHVIIIEEAHGVLANPIMAQDGSVMGAETIEVVTNMFAEFRKLGEGVIIITQDPNRLGNSLLSLPQTATIFELKDEPGISKLCEYFTKLRPKAHLIPDLKKGEGLVVMPQAIEPIRVQYPKFPKKQSVDISEDEMKKYMRETYYKANPLMLESWDEDQSLFELPVNEMAKEITDYQDLLLGIKLKGVDITCARIEYKFFIQKAVPGSAFLPKWRRDYLLSDYLKELQTAKFETPSVQVSIEGIQGKLAGLDLDRIPEDYLFEVFAEIMELAVQAVPVPIPIAAITYFLRLLVFKYLKFKIDTDRVNLFRQLIQFLVKTGAQWLHKNGKVNE